MKRLILRRDIPSPTEIQGRIVFAETTLFSMERPWIPTEPGGKPRKSCVPAGLYELRHHTRPNGDESLALINHGLGVYYLSEDREVGRYLILIHAGNWVSDVIGCIAPGLERADSSKGPMVTNSRKAMRKILDWIDGDPAELEILGDNLYS